MKYIRNFLIVLTFFDSSMRSMHLWRGKLFSKIPKSLSKWENFRVMEPYVIWFLFFLRSGRLRYQSLTYFLDILYRYCQYFKVLNIIIRKKWSIYIDNIDHLACENVDSNLEILTVLYIDCLNLALLQIFYSSTMYVYKQC